MQKQTQDRFGQYFREGDSISVCGTVVEINEPLITVLIEDVGTPGYVPLRIVEPLITVLIEDVGTPGYVPLRIVEPLITVLIEDVGTPGYVPLRIVVNAKQCSKGN